MIIIRNVFFICNHFSSIYQHGIIKTVHFKIVLIGWNKQGYKRMLFNKNTIYKCSIKLSFSNIGQDNSKLQKQLSKTVCYI